MKKLPVIDFNCIQDCSQCCIEREYYPSKKFGKIGVLILPHEKEKIESLAKQHKIDIKILPRIGVSYTKSTAPTQILAYQLMGKDEDGNTCPFLDTTSTKRSPHGGYACMIYNNRPLACSAYPLIEYDPLFIDDKCKFCREHGNTATNLDAETDSLVKIKSSMNTSAPYVWRYATGIGDNLNNEIQTGWILES